MNDEQNYLEDWLRDRNEERPVEQLKPHPVGEGFRWFFWYLIGIALLCIGLAFFGTKAHAQAEPPFTFGASVTSGNGELATTLTWDAPGASGCVGAGHPAWNGDKAASGSLALPVITLSGMYSLTLACTWPGDMQARLRWTNPTTNTDGTGFANPKLIRIHWGASADALTHVRDVPLVAGALPATHTITDLAVGTWFFAVRAVNALDVESALSNVTSKVITAAQSHQRSIALTINPVPSAATGLEAT